MVAAQSRLYQTCCLAARSALEISNRFAMNFMISFAGRFFGFLNALTTVSEEEEGECFIVSLARGQTLELAW